MGAGIDRQSTMKSFSFEKNKFSYRVYDGIGIEKLKEEITRWESIFDSEHAAVTIKKIIQNHSPRRAIK